MVSDDPCDGTPDLPLTFAPAWFLWIMLVRHAEISTQNIDARLSKNPGRRVVREARHGVDACQPHSRALMAELAGGGGESISEQLGALSLGSVMSSLIFLLDDTLTPIRHNQGDHAARTGNYGQRQLDKVKLIVSRQLVAWLHGRRSKARPDGQCCRREHYCGRRRNNGNMPSKSSKSDPALRSK
jgi:hypothetical protein